MLEQGQIEHTVSAALANIFSCICKINLLLLPGFMSQAEGILLSFSCVALLYSITLLSNAKY